MLLAILAVLFAIKISVINSNKILLISARGSGRALHGPQVWSGAEPRKPKHFYVLHSLKSFKGD